jgi:hypothetical protein
METKSQLFDINKIQQKCKLYTEETAKVYEQSIVDLIEYELSNYGNVTINKGNELIIPSRKNTNLEFSSYNEEFIDKVIEELKLKTKWCSLNDHFYFELKSIT